MPKPWASHAVVRIVGELHGARTNNVLHFATNSNITDNNGETLMLALLNALVACIMDKLLAATTSDWTFSHVEGQYIGSVTNTVSSDPWIVNATSSPSNGALSATSVSFAASLVHIRSRAGGRNGRGRIFLPPPGETEVTASVMSDPTLDLIVEFLTCVATKFMGASPTTDWRLGVYSRKLGAGVFGNFDNAFFEAVTLDAANTLAVMGTRKKGRGV